VNLDVTFSASASALPGMFDGTIQLRSGDDPKKTYAKPLAVTVEVEWPRFSDSLTGASFSYTTFGATGTVSSDTVNFGAAGTGTIYYVKFPTQSSPTPATQYLITILPNSQYQSIHDWFVGNVDPGQLLVKGGSFEFRQFTNGIEALVLTGSIPPGYDGGPVSEVFAMSASKKSVVTIATSNDDTMRRVLS
jgi:hypothetical protein